MSQDSFNKLVTLILLGYTMLMFTLAYVMNRQLDLQGFFIIIAPLVSHAIQLVDNKIESKNAI